MKTFATTDAAAMLAAEDRDRPRDKNLATFFSPDQSQTVYCTVDEMEDFEDQCMIALTADVIEDQSDYDRLVRFLVANYDLEAVS